MGRHMRSGACGVSALCSCLTAIVTVSNFVVGVYNSALQLAAEIPYAKDGYPAHCVEKARFHLFGIHV